MKFLIMYLIGTLICGLLGVGRMREGSPLALRQGGWLLATCYLWPFWLLFYLIALPWEAVVSRRGKTNENSEAHAQQ